MHFPVTTKFLKAEIASSACFRVIFPSPGGRNKALRIKYLRSTMPGLVVAIGRCKSGGIGGRCSLSAREVFPTKVFLPACPVGWGVRPFSLMRRITPYILGVLLPCRFPAVSVRLSLVASTRGLHACSGLDFPVSRQDHAGAAAGGASAGRGHPDARYFAPPGGRAGFGRGGARTRRRHEGRHRSRRGSPRWCVSGKASPTIPPRLQPSTSSPVAGPGFWPIPPSGSTRRD